MILWCTKCREFRKNNTPDWRECRYSSRHTLVPGHERMEKEMRQVREKIAASGKPKDEDLKRLGALEAVKNAESDSDDEMGHIAVIVDGMIAGHACTESDPGGAFFWVKSDGSWDLLRHDDTMVADLIQAEYLRKYGVVVQDYYMRTVLAAHRLRAKFDGLRADRVWKRAGFDGHTLWVDLGGRPRHLYGISAEKHGPAVPYGPDARVVIERHGAAMPVPERGGEGWLEAFRAMLRVPESQAALFCAHLCHMLCMHHETPAMLFSGPPGSGKTATIRLVRELVDPVGLEHAAAVLPKSAENLRKILAGSPVASFGNARRIGRETADSLSGALEGLAMQAGGQKHPASFGNVRIIMAAPEGKPGPLHSLAGKVVRYELPPVDEWKTMGEMAAEFYSMRPHLYHEMFDILHRAFGDSPGTRPSTRMADFEVLGRSIAKHAGYDADEFARSLRLALDDTMPGRILQGRHGSYGSVTTTAPAGGADDKPCEICNLPLNGHDIKELAACLVKAVRELRDLYRKTMGGTAGGDAPA